MGTAQTSSNPAKFKETAQRKARERRGSGMMQKTAQCGGKLQLRLSRARRTRRVRMRVSVRVGRLVRRPPFLLRRRRHLGSLPIGGASTAPTPGGEGGGRGGEGSAGGRADDFPRRGAETR